MASAYAHAARLTPDTGRLFGAAARILLAWHGRVAAQQTLEGLLGPEARLTAHGLVLAQAAVAAALGDGGRAMALLSPLAKSRPTDVGVQTLLADVEARFGKQDAALVRLTALLRDDPSDPWRLNALGYTLVEAGQRLPEAAVYLRRALRLTFIDALVADSFGRLLLVQKRLDDAVFWLEEAHRRSPQEPEILCHLGDAYAAQKRLSQAVPMWRAALAAYPDALLRAQLLDRLKSAHASS